ncbi:hypothetical protein IF650_01875 [Cellulosimicrobium terreum]|nr:hypothetical protein [Cellulosimicrobium terreum]
MALVAPEMLLNSMMGKVYDVLTNGDDTVPRSEEFFFSWATPGIPLEPEDVRFLTQGLTGIARRPDGADALPAAPPADGAAPADGTAAGGMSPADLEQLRATDAGQLLVQAEAFARLLDFVPDPAATVNDQFATLQVKNDKGGLSENYEYLLDMSQVAASELDEATKANVVRLTGLLQKVVKQTDIITGEETELVQPSDLVTAYNAGLERYESAALAYNTARIDALAATNQRAVQNWAINAPILRNRVKAAMASWVSEGHKNDYEKIAAFLDQVQRRDLSLLKARYRDDLDKAKLTGAVSGSDFYYTSVVPGNFLTASGWTEFTFGSGDFAQERFSSYSLKRSSSASGGGFFGIFGNAKAGTQVEGESARSFRFESEQFSMSFQIAQVPIVRPWFKTAYLTSKSWRMSQANVEARGEFASDGGTPRKGRLPAYPTALVLVRDVTVSFRASEGMSSFQSEWESAKSTSGKVFAFGPIVVAGGNTTSRYSSSSNSSSRYHWDGQTLKVDGAQIIGFKCALMPKAPDPLPEITSWV